MSLEQGWPLSTVFASSDWALLAVGVGGCALALQLVYSAVQVIRARPNAGFLNAILALVASGAICSGTANMSLFGRLDSRAVVVTLVSGLVSLIAGIVLFTRERNLDNYNPAQSPGLLCAGVGLLTLVIGLILPVLPTQFVLPAPTLIFTATPTLTRTPPPTRTPLASATPTAVPSLTFTPTLLPSLTARPSSDAPALPTSILPSFTPTATLVSCTVTVVKNVNLRRGPSATEPLILTVPYSNVLTVLGRSQDRNWWRVTYNGQEGWVSGDFVTPDSVCKSVPTATP